MVSHYMPPHAGGIQTVADALYAVYAASGCEVRWVASRVPRTAAPREEGRIRVGCWNSLERWFGVPWPIWGADGVRELAALVRWADVLHVHDCLYLGSALTVLLARRARAPVLLSQHIGFIEYRAALLRLIEHAAYHALGSAVLKRADHIVFCTPAAEEFVGSLLGGPPPRATAIPYGVDTTRFRVPTDAERGRARAELGLPPSTSVVLFVGRLVEKKGVELLLDVCRRHGLQRFLIVGDGPLRPPALANVTWVPAVPLARMPDVYQAADAFLLPSHSEGFPLAILEAMACGLPVITSRGQAFGELLEREGACLLADRTATALSAALTRLAATQALSDGLAARGRALVKREWGLDVMGARYLKILHGLAQRNGAGG